MDRISDLLQLLSKTSITTSDPAGKGKKIAPEKKNQPDVTLPSGMDPDDIEFDEDDELRQLLSKTSITTSDPVPADFAGKGKEIAPEKKQPDVKFPSGLKLPSGIDDIEFDEDDELPQPGNPIPAYLAGKPLSSSNHPIKTDDVNDKDTADDENGELPKPEYPIPVDLDGKPPSSSNHPIKADDVNDKDTAEDEDDELPKPENPIPVDLAGKPPSSSNHPIMADDVNDKDTTAEDDDDDDEHESLRRFRFEQLPGGRYRLEMPTPPGFYFDTMGFEGPDEDGHYVLSYRHSRFP